MPSTLHPLSCSQSPVLCKQSQPPISCLQLLRGPMRTHYSARRTWRCSRAKELGRNRCALYRPSLYDAAAQRCPGLNSRCAGPSKRAISMLMYQPQVALAVRSKRSAWKRSSLAQARRSHRPPRRRSIHIAEKTGMMPELTEWGAQRRHIGRGCVACAGLGTRVCRDQRLSAAALRRRLRRPGKAGSRVTRLPASALELELTESVFQTGSSPSMR